MLGVSFQKYMDFFRNLPELIQDKTAIYVSHRMSNCKFCDQIIVLDNGQILEEGEHETLLEKQGRYYELFNAQAVYYTQNKYIEIKR